MFTGACQNVARMGRYVPCQPFLFNDLGSGTRLWQGSPCACPAWVVVRHSGDMLSAGGQTGDSVPEAVPKFIPAAQIGTEFPEPAPA